MEDEEIGSTDHFYFGPGLPPLRTSPGQHSLETPSRSQRRPLTTRAKYICLRSIPVSPNVVCQSVIQLGSNVQCLNKDQDDQDDEDDRVTG